MLAFLRRSAIALAWAYPAGLVLVLLAFRWLGEDWWVTAAALYLPRAGFGLPLLVLLPALLLFRAYRALWPLLLAAVLLVWPLMGLSVALPWPKRDPTALRVLSLNANSCVSGSKAIAASILQYRPDLVLLQELSSARTPLEAELRRHYRNVQASTQFIIASRFPIIETSDPDRAHVLGTEHSARYLRHVLRTPRGDITVFNIHPTSPRPGLNEIRGPRGFRHELQTGRAFSSHAAPEVQSITELRRAQVEAVIGDATDERNPVIIAGDSNLPTLSKLARANFAGFADGFSEAGMGFGYTYPARLSWMRIDRILASPAFRFITFEVGCAGVSDHLCVVAELSQR
jgi:vancomycin resistance protein VanJ